MLLGRETEIAQLDAALRLAIEHGGAFLISGPPGIGKTSLLKVAADEARTRGYKVLAVTGVESESHLPYAGLHQLLQSVLPAADRLAAPQKTALLTALGLSAEAPPEMFLVALAALNLIDEAAGEKAIVLIADDVQWLDGLTSSVLTFIARRLESTHIVLVIGLRDGFEAELRSAHLSEIHVGPLSDEASVALLYSVAPDLERLTRRRILTNALGNPLALVELPRALSEQTLDGWQTPTGQMTVPLTDRLERSFSAQAAQLPKQTQSALLLAALDDAPSLAEVVGAARIQTGDEATVDVLEPALDSGLILLIAGSDVRFRHPLIRSALDQAATPAQRRAAHSALAQVVADPDRHAWHRAASVLGTDEGAAADLEATAARAQGRGATTIALSAQELAASLTPDGAVRARRLLAAAEMAFQLGEPAVVRRLLDAAAKLELTPHDVARMTWLREIFHDGMPGDPLAITKLVAIAREAAAQSDRNLALNLLQGAARRCFWADPGLRARTLVVETVEQIGGDELDPRVLEILSFAAPVETGARVSLAVAKAAQPETADPFQTQLLGFAASAAGDYGQGMELLNRAASGLRAQGRLGLLAQLLVARAWDAIVLGQFGDAIRDADEGNRLAIETEQSIFIAQSQTARALLLGLRGEDQLAQQLITDAAEPLRALRPSIILAAAELARGLTAMTVGRYSDAFDHFARMFDPDDMAFSEYESCLAVGYVIESAVRADRRKEASQIMVKLEALGKRTPAPLLHVGLRYARAVLAHESEAENLYQIALHAEPKWPFDYARLQLSYGAWLRRQRRITESRPYLRAARDTFEALGVHPWADKARVELRASGESIAEPSSALRQPLSSQELQIAQMAATGLSNREIADRLFLSHRTVGAHLYRVYPKLGIASRFELARALAPLEPALTM